MLSPFSQQSLNASMTGTATENAASLNSDQIGSEGSCGGEGADDHSRRNVERTAQTQHDAGQGRM
jgi:hypothetical protein